MPDNQDHEWLGRMLETPEMWTPEETAVMQRLLKTQRQAVEQAQPLDEERRRSLTELARSIEIAVERALQSSRD